MGQDRGQEGSSMQTAHGRTLVKGRDGTEKGGRTEIVKEILAQFCINNLLLLLFHIARRHFTYFDKGLRDNY